MAFGFDGPIRAVVTGARGGVGEALVRRVLASHPESRVWVTSRVDGWVPASADLERVTPVMVDLTEEATIAALAEQVDRPNLVLGAHGILHHDGDGPERTWREMNPRWLCEVFGVDAFAAIFLIKHLLPRMPRDGRTVIGMLSARVGSIGDNHLGGWYGYRAAKAAQNMLVKTASIEAARRWHELVCVSLHPGTVDTALSAPYVARVPETQLFTPDTAAAHLDRVVAGLGPEHTGGFYAWDGSTIPW